MLACRFKIDGHIVAFRPLRENQALSAMEKFLASSTRITLGLPNVQHGRSSHPSQTSWGTLTAGKTSERCQHERPCVAKSLLTLRQEKSIRVRYTILLEATWRSGDAAACKAVYAGSIPAVASTLSQFFRRTTIKCLRRWSAFTDSRVGKMNCLRLVVGAILKFGHSVCA